MSLARRLNEIERKLEGIVSIQEKQIYLLQQMMRLCGSDFSAFNLLDRELRIVGGVAWPLTEERVRMMQTLNPVLGALLKSSPVSEALRFGAPRKAVAIDSAVLHDSLVYREVYEPMGMHHLATFVYPGSGDYMVGVGISSSSAPFTAAQVRALERLCLRFEDLISNQLKEIGPVLSFAKPGDWRVRVEADLARCELNDYATGLLASYYGDLANWVGKDLLPPDLTESFRERFRLQDGGSIPVLGSRSFSISKVARGRRLNMFLEEFRGGDEYFMILAEDAVSSELLQKVSDACHALSRDTYGVYRACLALLDGYRCHDAIVQNASLAGLRVSSARRIVSRAKSVLLEVERVGRA